MTKYFGTDGIRGEANVLLTPTLAYQTGLALSQILREEGQKNPRVLVGRDPRRSGPMLESALASGICAGGGEVQLLGIIPTPAVSYLVRQEKAAAGVVISASHNAYYDNGIKIFGADGRKLAESLERRLETWLTAEEAIPLALREEIGTIDCRQEGAKLYCDHLYRCFPLTLTGRKFVVDMAHGATAGYADALLRELGAEVVALHGEPDGVRINEQCGSTKPQRMAAAVPATGAEAGIAYDGDGDRLIMADAAGTIVDGDQLLGIIARHLLTKGELSPPRLVVTVMSNLGLRRAMASAGIALSTTAVGDKYVMAEMDRSGAIVGGEQSGHIILSQYNPTGDGVLTSLMILHIMTETRRSLRELAAAIPLLPQQTVNIRVKRREEWRENEAVQAAIAAARQTLGGEETVLVRPSGTEPLLRVTGQGPDDEILNATMHTLVETIKEALGTQE